MSMEGRYLQQSYSKAVSYLQKAVSLNHVKAATKLGQMYIKGSGCEYNPVAAADLFTTAANHGDTEAQFELAKLFKQGIENFWAIPNGRRITTKSCLSSTAKTKL